MKRRTGKTKKTKKQFFIHKSLVYIMIFFVFFFSFRLENIHIQCVTCTGDADDEKIGECIELECQSGWRVCSLKTASVEKISINNEFRNVPQSRYLPMLSTSSITQGDFDRQQSVTSRLAEVEVKVISKIIPICVVLGSSSRVSILPEPDICWLASHDFDLISSCLLFAILNFAFSLSRNVFSSH